MDLNYDFSMRHDKIEIYAHILWTTYDRHPLISPQLEAELFPLICNIGESHGVKTLAINGMPDHLHWLAKFSSTTRLCDLVKEAKGASARLALKKLDYFKWRPTYAAFSVSRWDIRNIAGYVAGQKEHHASGDLKMALESGDELIYD
jgi:putative transposase